MTAGEPKLPEIKLAPAPEGIALVLQADPSVWDGRYAGNPWLQECPKPFTKQVWGNALGLNEATARKAGLSDGGRVRISRGAKAIEATVLIQKGHADGVASLSLGYGRWNAGAIGSDLGANAFALRETASPWVLAGVKLEKVSAKNGPAIATAVVKLDSHTEELFPVLSLAAAPSANFAGNHERQPSLLPEVREHAPAWAMVIDNAACIGCNACVIACQAENNVPVVGPEEIEVGRIMHWLRIDRYEGGTPAAAVSSPCPACIARRRPASRYARSRLPCTTARASTCRSTTAASAPAICEANCPYKVRRFNFFGYASGQEYKTLGAEVLHAQKNPDVTVRARGVMEKCTYCIQRIARARATAAKENRDVAEGEVVTACAAACPTQAISFRRSEQARLRGLAASAGAAALRAARPSGDPAAHHLPRQGDEPESAFQQVSERDAG